MEVENPEKLEIETPKKKKTLKLNSQNFSTPTTSYKEEKEFGVIDTHFLNFLTLRDRTFFTKKDFQKHLKNYLKTFKDEKAKSYLFPNRRSFKNQSFKDIMSYNEEIIRI